MPFGILIIFIIWWIHTGTDIFSTIVFLLLKEYLNIVIDIARPKYKANKNTCKNKLIVFIILFRQMPLNAVF